MTISRRAARPLLAAVFISGGIETLRNPAPRVKMAEPVAPPVGRALGLPSDTEQLVKINATVQVAAGLLLAIGRLPRLAATALAGSRSRPRWRAIGFGKRPIPPNGPSSRFTSSRTSDCWAA